VEIIVIPSNDGEKVAAHPGHAKYLVVARVDDGKVHSIDVQDNPILALPHGPMRRQALVQEMKGAHAFVARGIGRPLVHALEAMNVRVFLTQERLVSTVLERYLTQSLDHHPERIHEHHDGHEHHDHHHDHEEDEE